MNGDNDFLAEPIGVDCVIPDCCEDKMVVPQKTYFSGQEGENIFGTERKTNYMGLASWTYVT